VTDPDGGNNANFHDGSNYAIGSPYYANEAGEFELSTSPYGTFDQGGNAWEWNEAVFGSWRGLRGGFRSEVPDRLLASYRITAYPTSEIFAFGFRVASVPEPGSMAISLVGLGGLIATWWRRRKATCGALRLPHSGEPWRPSERSGGS